MKKIIFPILGMIMLGLSSCNDGDNIKPYWDVPAIVGFNSELSQPTLITSEETFIAPMLQRHLSIGDISLGDALLTFFEVNFDQQSFPGHIEVSFLEAWHIDKTFPRQTITSEDHTTIENIAGHDVIIFNNKNNIVLFFAFEHLTHENQMFEYIMTYDPDDIAEMEIPTLYIRARKDGEGSGNVIDVRRRIHAFDMSEFYRISNKSKINIKFKIGEDQDGDDIFRSWARNPFELISSN